MSTGKMHKNFVRQNRSSKCTKGSCAGCIKNAAAVCALCQVNRQIAQKFCSRKSFVILTNVSSECTILGLKVCAICLLTAGGKCAIMEWGAHFRGAPAYSVLGGTRYLALLCIGILCIDPPNTLRCIIPRLA